MTLSPMRYKGYVWPHNPRVYAIDYERKMAAHKTPFGLFQLQDLGRTNRIMRGEGEFVGPGAYEEFGRLANVFYQKGAGLLVHPLWQAANAYFVSLRLMQEPRPDYVRYAFTFWEDDSPYSKVAVRVEQEQSLTGGAGESTGKQVYRVVQGDTLWAIAAAFQMSMDELIALNPQIKNPNLIRVGDEVRVQ